MKQRAVRRFRPVTHDECHQADLFMADLMGQTGSRASRIQPEWESAFGEARKLIEGPLTDDEWRSVILMLSRGEAEIGAPFTNNAERNALLVAAQLFCARNALSLEREDPLLCVLPDVTRVDRRVRALVPHVQARGPIDDWTRHSRGARILQVMTLLVRTHGYPINGAAGLVGNLQAESGVLPQRIEDSAEATPMREKNFSNKMTDFTAAEIMNRSEATRTGPKQPGIGLAQWTVKPRRPGLFAHKFRGITLGPRVLFDMEAQVDYLVTELRSTGFAAAQRALTNATVTVDAASDAVLYNFEIPGAIKSGNVKLPRTDPRVITVFNQRRPLAHNAHRIYTQAIAAAARPAPPVTPAASP